MHAIEAKYHKNCLTETYNKFCWQQLRNQCGERELFSQIEDLAFADIVQYIKETISNDQEDDIVPVFTQKSLTDLYKKRIKHHGIKYDNIDAESFAENTHATRLREKVLA